jgi:hypothetical protein
VLRLTHPDLLESRARIELVLIAFWMGWWVLLLVALAGWATLDYVKRGDMFSAVDHAASHHIRTGEDGKSRFGSDD